MTTGISEVCTWASNGHIVQPQERCFIPARDVLRTRVFDFNNCTIFDNDFKAVSHGIPAEFQWNPMDSIGNHSRRLPDTDHFHRNSLEKVGISMEMETQMAEAPAKCFP